jgi:hypothetical protein
VRLIGNRRANIPLCAAGARKWLESCKLAGDYGLHLDKLTFNDASNIKPVANQVSHFTNAARDGRATDRMGTIVVLCDKNSKTLIDKIGGEMPFFVTCKCEFPILFG